jgi:hypothetical protein
MIKLGGRLTNRILAGANERAMMETDRNTAREWGKVFHQCRHRRPHGEGFLKNKCVVIDFAAGTFNVAGYVVRKN